MMTLVQMKIMITFQHLCIVHEEDILGARWACTHQPEARRQASLGLSSDSVAKSMDCGYLDLSVANSTCEKRN